MDNQIMESPRKYVQCYLFNNHDIILITTVANGGMLGLNILYISDVY